MSVQTTQHGGVGGERGVEKFGPALQSGGIGPSASGSSRSSTSSQNSAPWKSEAEETAKTRRNALRVIVQKLRGFWPADTESKLTERATLLEKGVFDVTTSKNEYIQRLQRDLGLLTNKKELAIKAARLQMQQASDIFAHQTQEDARTGIVPPNHTADAKAKFTQKIYSMEKKHSNKFMLLKLSDDRLRHTPQELKMKDLLVHFKTQHGLRERGPFDIKKLNEIDEHLDRLQAQANSRSTVHIAPSRETTDKQNDRTNQIGQRMFEKLRKLNRERPFAIAELSWTLQPLQRDGMNIAETPPELALVGGHRKRETDDSDRPEKRACLPTSHGADASHENLFYESDAAAQTREFEASGNAVGACQQRTPLPSLPPYCSVGGPFVASVREFKRDAIE